MPDCAGILEDWSDVGLVCCLFELGGVYFDISSQESELFVGLAADTVNMKIPLEVVLQRHPKVFDGFLSLKSVAMELVVTSEGLDFTGDG